MGVDMDENEVVKTEENFNEETSQDTPVQKDMKHLDFITSLVVMAVAIYTAVMAYGYYIDSGKEFYASPGFMPTIIAGALFLLAVYLMVQSLNKSSVRELVSRLREALPRGLKSARFKNTTIGLAMFFVYVYVLLRFLPFWLSSIILLFACFMYLKAAKLVKSAVIAVLSAVGIVLLFQTVFRVPLP